MCGLPPRFEGYLRAIQVEEKYEPIRCEGHMSNIAPTPCRNHIKNVSCVWLRVPVPEKWLEDLDTILDWRLDLARL